MMKIGFIGCGNMATAIIKGMLGKNFLPDSIWVSDKNLDMLRLRSQQLHFVVADNKKIANECSVIVLAIKPQDMKEVATKIKKYLTNEQLVISILAGISTTKISKLLGITNIIRVMPNIAAKINQSATTMFAKQQKNKIAEQIFSSVGKVFWLAKEEQIDIATILAGSGPAYFYLLCEIMIKQATKMGLEHNIAQELCMQTALGAAMTANIANIKDLREVVSSKGGTTEVAITTMQTMNIAKIINQAMINAHKRTKELNAN